MNNIPIDVIIVSSGRKEYLFRSLRRLMKTKNFHKIGFVHVVMNHTSISQFDKISIELKQIMPAVRISHLTNSTHISLLKNALQIGNSSNYIFYLEEDWLLSKSLDWSEVLKYASEIAGWRQISLNKYWKKQIKFSTFVKYMMKYNGSLVNITVSDKDELFMSQKKLFTLNPNLMERGTIQHLLNNYSWGKSISGYALEMDIGEFLRKSSKSSLLSVHNSSFFVRHIGLVNTTHYHKLLDFEKSFYKIRFYLNHFSIASYLMLPSGMRQFARKLFLK